MEEPLVSILIPCWNADRWIAHCIESALEQTYDNKEIIVVDDGSTDQSLRIIKGYGDKIVWETGPNRGGNASRNRLLELSKGHWLQYLDADDYLLPHKIEAQLSAIQNGLPADVMFSPETIEYQDSLKIRQEKFTIRYPDDPWMLLITWNLPQTGAALWKRQALMDVDGWNEDQPCCQEHELYFRLLTAGKKFHYVPGHGAIYRRWGLGTVCHRDIKKTFSEKMKIITLAGKYLLENREMNGERQNAINQEKFAAARLIWNWDSEHANRVMEQVKVTDSKFEPRGHGVSGLYRWAYKCGGFPFSEKIARWKRRFAGLLSLLEQ